VLIPKFEPCAMMLPAVPPTIAPSTWPAIAPISYFVAFVA
jgi:hypothetical protein